MTERVCLFFIGPDFNAVSVVGAILDCRQGKFFPRRIYSSILCINAANKINGLGYPKKGLKKDSIFGKIQTKYGLEEAN